MHTKHSHLLLYWIDWRRLRSPWVWRRQLRPGKKKSFPWKIYMQVMYISTQLYLRIRDIYWIYETIFIVEFSDIITIHKHSYSIALIWLSNMCRSKMHAVHVKVWSQSPVTKWSQRQEKFSERIPVYPHQFSYQSTSQFARSLKCRSIQIVARKASNLIKLNIYY